MIGAIAVQTIDIIQATSRYLEARTEGWHIGTRDTISN